VRIGTVVRGARGIREIAGCPETRFEEMRIKEIFDGTSLPRSRLGGPIIAEA
jgi:hypothetical protein